MVSDMTQNKSSTDTKPQVEFYRISTLVKMLGISRSHIWNLVKSNQFPKPVKLSENCTAWRASEVSGWIQSRN